MAAKKINAGYIGLGMLVAGGAATHIYNMPVKSDAVKYAGFAASGVSWFMLYKLFKR